MKNELPLGETVPEALLRSGLFHYEAGRLSLTDAQHAGIAAGAVRGQSFLLVAPTSSGKTEVGLMAMASWLTGADAMPHRAVYLVSHRALARQKFNELVGSDYIPTCRLAPSEIVMSNGDMSIDGEGAAPDEPLNARLLVATYEKFLALLAGSGLRQDMTHYCIVADEFQLIADATRGRDLEILFTMILQAGYGQFVGLSAVLDQRDLDTLAGWLGVTPVIVHTREVPLEYELRTSGATYVWRTDGPDEPEERPAVGARDVIGILTELEADAERNFPLAVFCMTKARVEELARAWGNIRGVDGNSARLQPDLFTETTALAGALAVYMPQGFGIHTADLIEGERELVEQALDRDGLAVVFATTTLAQGLNYSFKTVVFDSWSRWNFERRVAEPITRGDFHNIAGRAGRLGRMQGGHGRVIFCTSTRAEEFTAARYLNAETESRVTGQIDTGQIDHIALQLLSAGIVGSAADLLSFLQHSLTGHIARNAGRNQDDRWQALLDSALRMLTASGFIE